MPDFTLKYATRNPGVGWNSWTDYSTYLMRFNVNRSVKDWHLGPKAATGAVLIEDIAGNHYCPAGGKLQISVDVPSGTEIIFEGIVLEQTLNLHAAEFPTATLYVTDSFGYDAQTPYTPSTLSDTTDALLIDAIDAVSWSGYSTQFDSSVITQGVLAAEYNFPDLISTLVRGELGMLWTTRKGEWAFAAQGWWNANRTTAAAAIGDSGPPDAYTYLFPGTAMSPTKRMVNVINSAVWETPFASGESQTVEDTTGFDLYKERRYHDTVNVTADTEAASAVWRLVYLYSEPRTQLKSVKFHADLSTPAMEYAARAEITDFLNVALESLEGYWSEWVRCHVTGVSHSWSPDRGWEVELQVITGLFTDWDPWILGTDTLGSGTVLD